MGSPSSWEFHLGLGSKLQAKEFCLRMQYLCLFLHAQGPARRHWSALVKYQQLLVTFGNPKNQQNQQQKNHEIIQKKKNFEFLIYLSAGLQMFGIFLLCATKVTWRLLLLLLCWLGSQNHGMALMGRKLKFHLIPTHCSQQGHLPPDQDVLTMEKRKIMQVSW